MRQFASVPGVFDRSNTIPNVRVRPGRQQPRQCVEDTQRVGVDLQRPLEMNDRLVHSTLLQQSISKVVVGFRVLGVDLQRLLEMNYRFVHPLLLEENVAEVVVRSGVLVVDLQGLLILNNRFVRSALLQPSISEVMWASA